MKKQELIIFLKEKIEEIEEVLTCREKFDESIHFSEEHLKNKLKELKEELESLTEDASIQNDINPNSITYYKTLKRLHIKHRKSNKHSKEQRLSKNDLNIGNRKRKKGFKTYKSKRIRNCQHLVGKGCLFKKIYNYQNDIND